MRWIKLDFTCICFLNLHHPFIPAESIIWIFFIFWPGKIHVNPTGIVSSLSPPRCRLSSVRHHHTTALCHASFAFRQDELAASTSTYDSALSRRLPSWVKTEALNQHHRRRLSSPDHQTPTLHCYKNIISTLVTPSTTQSRLHFTSSLARAPRHRSSTHCHHSLSPLSHAHHPSVQQHSRWWTSRLFFTSRIA
jgi:hypothetical protein